MRGMKRNLTVQLEDAVIHKARVLAARRATSVSRLVADEISRLVDEDDRYQEAKGQAVAALRRPFRMGGDALPDRGSLHDR
jgi:hypothetical protein